MSNLPELKTTLKALVTEGIDQALKKLEAVLQPGSDRFNAFLQLKSRYSAYLNSIMLGGASKAELDGLYNNISYALLLFVDNLKEEDLKPGSAQVPAAGKRGELLYYIPHRMVEQRQYRCAVRVAYLKDLLFGGWQKQEEDEQQSIRVAEVMAVELLNFDKSEPFLIQTPTDTVQFLDADDFTEWLFFVTPLRLGEFPLLLRVSVIEVRNGREVKKDVVIEQRIVVAAMAPEPVEQFVKSDFQVLLGGSAGNAVAPGAGPPPSLPRLEDIQTAVPQMPYPEAPPPMAPPSSPPYVSEPPYIPDSSPPYSTNSPSMKRGGGLRGFVWLLVFVAVVAVLVWFFGC